MAGTRYSNFVKLQIDPITSGATFLTLSNPGDGNKLPDLTRYLATIIVNDDSEDPEIIKIISQDKGTDALTSIERGKLSTLDSNHNTGGKTYSLVIGPIAERESQVFNVSEYGMIADGGVTDNSPLLLEAIADVKALGGGTIKFDKTGTSYYGFLSTVTIDTSNIKIVGDVGVELRTPTANIFLFYATGEYENIEFKDIDIVGPFGDAATSLNTNEGGIYMLGTGALNRVSKILLSNVRIKGFGGMGARFKFCDQVNVLTCKMSNIHYAGTEVTSSSNGVFSHNYIRDINGSEVDNAYGALFSRNQGTEEEFPRSENWIISHNVIVNVPNWEGIDSKGGRNIVISSNVLKNTGSGINISWSADGTGNPLLAPQNVHVLNNSMDSEHLSQNALRGITFAGATNSVGGFVELATGSVVGNYIKRYGRDINNTFRGALYFFGTKGVLCSDNTFVECSPTGVLLDFDNYGLVLRNLSFLDTHQEGGIGNTKCIELIDGEQQVFIDGCAASAKEYVPGGSGSVNDNGIFIPNISTIDVILGTNDFSACVTPLNDSGRRATQSPIEEFQSFKKGLSVKYQDVNNVNLNLTTDHYYLAVTTSTTAVTLTLPATHVAGQRYEIRDKGGSLGTRPITIDRNGNLINGGASNYLMNTSGHNFNTVVITSNGTGWFTYRVNIV